jgi:multiple sugar transport system substrate-binding protein
MPVNNRSTSGGKTMSFKSYDKQTFIIDTANAYTQRKISKRDFLSKMGMAGIGMSAFATGVLGGARPFRGNMAHAAENNTPEDVAKFLKEAGKSFAGTTIRYTSEATPPTVVLDTLKAEFTELTGINVEIEIVPLEQVLAKATQDVQGQLGTYDIYYLDQAWTSTFSRDTIDPVQYYKDKPDLAMPGFDFDDFSKPLVEGICEYDNKWVGLPFDIPIFTLMYRKDLLEKHGIAVPKTYDDFTAAVQMITAAEKENGIFGTGCQAKSGHYSLECDWTQAVWGHGGSIFGADKKFSGNDAEGVAGLQWYQEMLRNSPLGRLLCVSLGQNFFQVGMLMIPRSKACGKWRIRCRVHILCVVVAMLALVKFQTGAIRVDRVLHCRNIPRMPMLHGCSCSGPVPRIS